MIREVHFVSEKVYSVLFLCKGNSARSIIAECVLNQMGAGRFKAYSAGSHPKGEVNPYALRLLERQGFDTTGLRSKSWEEFARPDAPKVDFVITVCDDAAAEVCPVWPGHPMTAHWGIPDPTTVAGSDAQRNLAFADTLRMLRNRVGIFVNLPHASIDRLSLRRRINQIGSTNYDGAKGQRA
jgi:arsenate reductase